MLTVQNRNVFPLFEGTRNPQMAIVEDRILKMEISQNYTAVKDHSKRVKYIPTWRKWKYLKLHNYCLFA